MTDRIICSRCGTTANDTDTCLNCGFNFFGDNPQLDLERDGIMTDYGLSQFIKDEFAIRDLVRVYYTDPNDGQKYAVNGGLHMKGGQLIQIKGLSSDKRVSEMTLWMKDIDDIERWPDQISPYKIEEEEEERYKAMLRAKSGLEERTLMELRAAGEEQNAKDSEGRAAGVRAVQEAIWDEDTRPFSETSGGNAGETLAEDEGYIQCGRCDAEFANLRAYWNHLDEHDMATLNSGKYSN